MSSTIPTDASSISIHDRMLAPTRWSQAAGRRGALCSPRFRIGLRDRCRDLVHVGLCLLETARLQAGDALQIDRCPGRGPVRLVWGHTEPRFGGPQRADRYVTSRGMTPRTS